MTLFSRKRLIAFIVALVLLMSSLAAGAEGLPVYASVSNARVFNGAGQQVGTVELNTAVNVLAVRDGVCLVERGGVRAFMLQSELSTAMTQTSSSAPNGITVISPTTFYVQKDGARVYNGSGKVIGTLAANTALTVTAYNEALALVSSGSAQGLMYRSDLGESKVSAQPDNGITTISPTAFYVQNDGAKVYNGSGKVIGALGLNTEVTVSAYNDVLALISCGGRQGLMYRTDLSSSRVETASPDNGVTAIAPTTFYVQSDGAKVVDGSGTQIAALSVNTPVVVDAYTDSLARVSNGSTVGFMLKTDLGSNKVETSYVLQYGATGEAVSKLQTRLKELGYFSGNVGGNYLDLTRAAVTAFQSAARLSATGVADEATLAALFSENAPKAPVSTGSTVQAATGTAVSMDWWTSDIQSIFARGTVAVVTDVATGIAWRVKRSGGTNHADVQPLTAADTAAMKKACGGSWSWNRRAIFVTINGVNYAASMNCMPHGSGSITDNDFNGHHCIHFTNSRTHGTNKVCSLHQAAIKKAAAATL